MKEIYLYDIDKGEVFESKVQLIVIFVVVNITSTDLKLGAVKSGEVSGWVIIAVTDDDLLSSYAF